MISELEMPRPGENPEDGVWAPDAMASDFDKALAKQEKTASGSTITPPEREQDR